MIRRGMNRRAIPIPENNGSKYFSYREAWGRIRKARVYGFYFEAVTLEESIISDRLISFLLHAGAIKPGAHSEKYSFGQLVRQWTELVPEAIPTKHFPDLRAAVDDWRKRRNKIVHGIVKCTAAADHVDVLEPPIQQRRRAPTAPKFCAETDLERTCREVSGDYPDGLPFGNPSDQIPFCLTVECGLCGPYLDH